MRRSTEPTGPGCLALLGLLLPPAALDLSCDLIVDVLDALEAPRLLPPCGTGTADACPKNPCPLSVECDWGSGDLEDLPFFSHEFGVLWPDVEAAYRLEPAMEGVGETR